MGNKGAEPAAVCVVNKWILIGVSRLSMQHLVQIETYWIFRLFA